MIVDIRKVNIAFNNAHRALLEKYGHPPSGGNHWKTVKQWWEQEYGVRLIADSGWARFDRLEFESEKDMTMFVLRWGS